MNLFAAHLHGAYPWILISLIVIVSLLALTLLGFVARRIKTAPIEGDAHLGQSAGSGDASVATSEEFTSLKKSYATLETETIKLRAMKDDYDALQQKVKFLESKLLEYEILQEEIGTLSTLKVENEKLKKEILQLQHEIVSARGDETAPKTAAGPLPPATEEVSSPEVSTPAPDISLTPPVLEASVDPVEPLPEMTAGVFPPSEMESEPKIDLGAIEPEAAGAEEPSQLATMESPPDPATKALDEMNFNMASENPVTPSVPSASLPVDDGLEGILAQIDALSPEVTNEKK